MAWPPKDELADADWKKWFAVVWKDFRKGLPTYYHKMPKPLVSLYAVIVVSSSTVIN
jgi:hypothetical protein